MKTGNKSWIDVLIVVGMMAVVILLCQPIGRKWNETQKMMYTGEEGVFSSDLDSYFYMRIAKEYTEDGFSSIRLFYHPENDELKTPLFVGETGELPVLISASAAFLWYVLSFLGIHVGIYSICIRMASVILACFVIPLYLFLKKRVSRLAAVFGAIFVTLGLPFFRHSAYGFFDTDALVGLFGIIIALSFLECVMASDSKKQIVYGITACFATLALYLSWSVFYIYPVIAVGISIAGLLFARIVLQKNNTITRKRLLVPGIFMAVLILMGLLIGQKDKLSVFFTGMRIQKSTETWPNPSKYISELTNFKLLNAKSVWEAFLSANLDYVSYLGGLLLFAFLLCSVVICLIHFVRKVKSSAAEMSEEAICFGATGIWALGTLCMTFFGNRYFQFLIIPAGIIAAFGFSYGTDYLTDKFSSVFSKRIWYLVAAVTVFCNFVLLYPYFGLFLAAAIIIFGFWGSKINAKGLTRGCAFAVLFSSLLISENYCICERFPQVNTPYEAAMKWISENTSPDAVVADFWDSGYYIQYYSDRRTVADGGTYDGTVFYWLGAMMNTEDEKLSAGIIRMLQTGGRSATELAVDRCGSKKAGVELLRTILPLNRDVARTYLKDNGWGEDEADKLLALSHPTECPDVYLVTSADRIKAMIYFEMFDSWDFSGNSEPRVRYHYSTQSEKALEKDGELSFQMMNEEGDRIEILTYLRIKGDEIKATVAGSDGTEYQCGRFIYEKDGQVVIDRCCDVADEGYEFEKNVTAYFVEEDGRVSVVLCQNGNLEPTFLNLFFFDGRNQSSFEKVYESGYPESLSIETSEFQRKIDTGTVLKKYPTSRVIVWKVHFE